MLRCILICVLYMLLAGFIPPFLASSFNTAPYMSLYHSFNRLIMVLQMMVLSETVVISVDHKAETLK